LLAAGFDTTSHALLFSMLHVARRQEIQQELFEEITRVAGKEPINASHIRQLKLDKNCVTEALRINPVIPYVGRKFDHPTVVAGYEIPPLTNLQMSNWSTGRDEKWYKDALEFLPHRHSREQKRSTIPLALKPSVPGQEAVPEKESP